MWVIEKRRVFGTIYNAKLPDHRTLSWYAGHETMKFADQFNINWYIIRY